MPLPKALSQTLPVITPLPFSMPQDDTSAGMKRTKGIAVLSMLALLRIMAGKVPGHYLSLGIAIGVASGIGFLLSCRKRYGQVAAGAFARPRGNRKERAGRYMKSLTLFSAPASVVVIAAGVVCFILLGMVWAILVLLLGMSIMWWVYYCITVVWERGHRMTLVADRGWMYAVDSAMPGNAGEGRQVQ